MPGERVWMAAGTARDEDMANGSVRWVSVTAHLLDRAARCWGPKESTSGTPLLGSDLDEVPIGDIVFSLLGSLDRLARDEARVSGGGWLSIGLPVVLASAVAVVVGGGPGHA